MMENPWNVNSISELQFYNCPSCPFKIQAKQTFIFHAFDRHPESVDYLKNIPDGSLDGLVCPWSTIEEEKFDPLDYYNEVDTVDNAEVEETDAELSRAETIEGLDNSSTLWENTSEVKFEDDDIEQNIDEKYLEDDFTPSSDWVDCDVCSEKLYLEVGSEKTLNDILKDHKGYYHNLKCKLCPVQCHTRDKLDQHILNRHSEFKCHQCNKIFERKQNFKKHMKFMHEGGKRFYCSKCNLSFTSNDGRSRHESECQGVVYCEKCGKKFKHRDVLSHHMKYKHPSSPKQYPCDFCDKVYNVYDSFYHHVKKFHSIHGESMNAICQLCGKKFSSKHHLGEHVTAVHEKSKNFKCDKCDKAFSLKKGLDLHLKYHEEFKFECDMCNKKFPGKMQLNNHVKGVHGEKKFECEKCDKKFSHKQNLKTHVKVVHEGFQGHNCEFCNQYFRTKPMLQRHIESTHEGIS